MTPPPAARTRRPSATPSSARGVVGEVRLARGGAFPLLADAAEELGDHLLIDGCSSSMHESEADAGECWIAVKPHGVELFV